MRTGGSPGLGLLVAIGPGMFLFIDGLGALSLGHGFDRCSYRQKGGKKSANGEMRETSEKGGAGAEPDHWIGVRSRPTF